MDGRRMALTCSTYSLVFLGTCKGISCSGGGPELVFMLSTSAALFQILIERQPWGKGSEGDDSEREGVRVRGGDGSERRSERDGIVMKV